MGPINHIVASLAMFCACCVARGDEWDEKLEAQARECSFVVLGRVTEVTSISYLNGETVAEGAIEVRRHLKGSCDTRLFHCEFRFGSPLTNISHPDDAVWFIRKKLPSQRFLVTDWMWGRDSLGRILATIARVDRNTRIPGMPTPQRGSAPVSIVLGCDDGTENATTSIRVPAWTEVQFVAQFENHDSAAQAVMPQLDGSDVHWRYPHYDLEVRDSRGKPVASLGVGRCGNIDALHARDIVLLEPGEVFRTWLRPYRRALQPGSYRARLKYTARQDLSTRGLALAPDDPEVADKIKTVWEGSIESNWVYIEITTERPATQATGTP